MTDHVVVAHANEVQADAEPGPQPDDICRFCRLGESEGGPLCAPCDCRGSLRWIHEACLQQWMQATNRGANGCRCDLCQRDIRWVPLYAPEMPAALSPLEVMASLLLDSVRSVVTSACSLVATIVAYVVPALLVAWSCIALFHPQPLTALNKSMVWIAQETDESPTLVLLVFHAAIALSGFFIILGVHLVMASVMLGFDALLTGATWQPGDRGAANDWGAPPPTVFDPSFVLAGTVLPQHHVRDIFLGIHAFRCFFLGPHEPDLEAVAAHMLAAGLAAAEPLDAAPVARAHVDAAAGAVPGEAAALREAEGAEQAVDAPEVNPYHIPPLEYPPTWHRAPPGVLGCLRSSAFVITCVVLLVWMPSRVWMGTHAYVRSAAAHVWHLLYLDQDFFLVHAGPAVQHAWTPAALWVMARSWWMTKALQDAVLGWGLVVSTAWILSYLVCLMVWLGAVVCRFRGSGMLRRALSWALLPASAIVCAARALKLASYLVLELLVVPVLCGAVIFACLIAATVPPGSPWWLSAARAFLSSFPRDFVPALAHSPLWLFMGFAWMVPVTYGMRLLQRILTHAALPFLRDLNAPPDAISVIHHLAYTPGDQLFGVMVRDALLRAVLLGVTVIIPAHLLMHPWLHSRLHITPLHFGTTSFGDQLSWDVFIMHLLIPASVHLLRHPPMLRPLVRAGLTGLCRLTHLTHRFIRSSHHGDVQVVFHVPPAPTAATSHGLVRRAVLRTWLWFRVTVFAVGALALCVVACATVVGVPLVLGRRCVRLVRLAVHGNDFSDAYAFTVGAWLAYVVLALPLNVQRWADWVNARRVITWAMGKRALMALLVSVVWLVAVPGVLGWLNADVLRALFASPPAELGQYVFQQWAFGMLVVKVVYQVSMELPQPILWFRSADGVAFLRGIRDHGWGNVFGDVSVCLGVVSVGLRLVGKASSVLGVAHLVPRACGYFGWTVSHSMVRLGVYVFALLVYVSPYVVRGLLLAVRRMHDSVRDAKYLVGRTLETHHPVNQALGRDDGRYGGDSSGPNDEDESGDNHDTVAGEDGDAGVLDVGGAMDVPSLDAHLHRNPEPVELDDDGAGVRRRIIVDPSNVIHAANE